MSKGKVIRNGQVAVLISGGCGSGWSTWNDHQDILLFHPKLIEMVETGKCDEIDEDWCKENLNLDNVWTAGAGGLEIEWVEQGAKFRVDEYDGSETLITKNDFDVMA